MTRTATRMAAAYAAAFLASWLIARLDLQPASVLIPGGAVLMAALLFVFYPVEGLGVFLLFSLLANTWQYRFDVDLRYFDELGLLVFVAVGAFRYWPHERGRWGLGETALLAFLAAGVASSLVSGVPIPIWVPGLLLMMKGVAFFYLTSALRLGRQEVERVGLIILAVAVVLLALGFIEALNPAGFQRALGLPHYAQARGGLVVVKSLFLHPAVFGWLTAFASLFLYARFIRARTWWVLPLALAFNVGTLLSGRRTPVLGVLLALLVAAAWYWLHASPGRTFARTWVPIAGGLVLIGAVFLPAISGALNDTIGDYANPAYGFSQILAAHPDPIRIAKVAPRTALYAGAVAIARDRFPFGVGFGRYGSFMSRLDYSPAYVHYGLERIYGLSPSSPIAIDDTSWPSILGETGTIGLIAFAAFIGTILVRLWRAVAYYGSSAFGAFGLGALLIFVQGLVASATAPVFVAPPIAYWLFGTAAVVLSIVRHERGASGQPSEARLQVSTE